MNTAALRFMGFGLLFLIIFVTGLRLTRAGAPYPVVLFNVHKLIALGAVFLFIAITVQAQRAAPLQAAQWLAIGLAGLCIIVLAVTGGLLSAMPSAPVFVHRLHQVVPFLAVLSVGASLYLLMVRGVLIPGG
jgi:hypothetical protein